MVTNFASSPSNAFEKAFVTGIREETDRILSSSLFADSPRLREFFYYVVHETLEGRADRIKGFTIAHDVFCRNPENELDGTAVVRVEAGRLRNLLARYYAGQGIDDPIIIDIPKGGYIPCFKRRSPVVEVPADDESSTQRTIDPDQSNARLTRAQLVGIGAIAAVFIVGAFALGYLLRSNVDTGEIPEPVALPQSANPSIVVLPFENTLGDLMAASTSDEAEALELYRQAFDIANPIRDSGRRALAREAFKMVIERFPSFPGGHAGIAYLAAFSAFMGPSDHIERDLDTVTSYAARAFALDAEFGLAHMALAYAHMARGEYSAARARSERAVAGSPNDPYLLAYHAFILSANGAHEAALAYVQRAIGLDPFSPRTPYRNILATIAFHAGYPQVTLDTLQEVRSRGDPRSMTTSPIVALAYADLGRVEEARRVLSQIPRTRIDSWLAFVDKSFGVDERDRQNDAVESLRR